jgi:hypothetical protein
VKRMVQEDAGRVISLDDLEQLDRLTKLVARGEVAEAERKLVIDRLWRSGVTQRELAERMTKASTSAGGSPVTGNAVWKTLNRIRKATA